MGSKLSGTVAGSVAGLVFGSGQSAYLAFLWAFSGVVVEKALGVKFTEPILLSSAESAISAAILFGAFFGLIYGWRYEGIPGRSPALKGLAMGLLLFLFNVSGLGLYLRLGIGYAVGFLVVNLVMGFVYGLVLSYLYYRMEIYRPDEPRRPNIPQSMARRESGLSFIRNLLSIRFPEHYLPFGDGRDGVQGRGGEGTAGHPARFHGLGLFPFDQTRSALLA